MPEPHTLLAFTAVAAGFVAIPGPSNLLVLARGLQGGTRAGLAVAAGCATGTMAYILATAAGLSALLASSPVVFALLHYAGLAYLGWLAIGMVRSRRAKRSPASGPRSVGRAYSQGLVVELGNPKVALFFLSLLPQFVTDRAGSGTFQLLVLGGVFVSIGLLSDCTYALLAGRLARRRHGGHVGDRAQERLL